MAPRKLIIPPKPRHEITLGSPATESSASSSAGSDDDMASSSEVEKADNDALSDSEYEDVADDNDLEDAEDESDELDFIMDHHTYAAAPSHEFDHEVYRSDSDDSSICDFPLDYDSEYDFGTHSPSKRQRLSPGYLYRDHDAEDTPSVRLADMSFHVTYEEPTFEIPPPAPLCKNSDPEEARLFFTELDLPTLPHSSSELDLLVLPDTVTIRKPRRQHHRHSSISGHVPLGDGFNNTSQATSPTKFNSHEIEEIETPPAKRGRTRGRGAQIPTPPASSHTSPARRVQVPSTSPVRRMRMSFSPPSPAPSTASKQKDCRIMDDDDALIMSSSSYSSCAVPEPLLRSGRTAKQEVKHLITNSGFNTSLRERMEKAYPKRRRMMGWEQEGWEDPSTMPSLKRGSRERAARELKIFEDETATEGVRPVSIRYRR